MENKYKKSILLIDFDDGNYFNSEYFGENKYFSRNLKETDQKTNEKVTSSMIYNLAILALKFKSVTIFWAKD